jgi:hypothetical protein
VVDQVAADGIVHAGQEGDLQLGADAVGGRDENRVLEDAFQGKEAAELADLLDPHALDHGLDPLDCLVAAVNADPGLLIGALWHGFPS